MIKIKIIINIEILLFIIIFIITKQINIYAIFIFFTLIHEIGHAITGRILGLKVKDFIIMPYGFKITFKNNREKEKLKKLIIALAGPIVNLIIMTLAIILKLHTSIIYSNLIIAIFNLIPIYPLDGGRVLKLILTMIMDAKKANEIVNKISNITIITLTAATSIVILYIKNIFIVIILAYLWYIVIRENKRYNLVKRVYEIIEKEHVGTGFHPCPRK